MITPNYPHNESERLSAVRSYNLLDTLEEEDYDSITKLISQICDVPISLITLLDTHRNFLKSHRGVDINESPRDISFCGHAILEPDSLFIIEDARKDPRFKENPLVAERSAIFYAGKALVNKDGFPLGTLCVFDVKPRKLTALQKEAIVNLSQQVVHLFELRKKNIELEKVQIELENKNKDLKNYAGIVSHDIKSPLANITALARLILEENREKFDDTTLQYFEFIEESTENLKEYANGILQQYTSQDQLIDEAENIHVKEFFETFKDIHMLSKDEFKYPTKGVLKNINRYALSQIFNNLIDNSIKYSTSDKKSVIIEIEENKNYYTFSVKDNSRGIDDTKKNEIFKLFRTGGVKDKYGKEGTGIGLATVKNLVTKLGGKITLTSKLGEGSTFTFTIKKLL